MHLGLWMTFEIKFIPKEGARKVIVFLMKLLVNDNDLISTWKDGCSQENELSFPFCLYIII